MARTLALREPTEEGRAALARLAHSRATAARRVERAHVVWAAARYCLHSCSRVHVPDAPPSGVIPTEKAPGSWILNTRCVGL